MTAISNKVRKAVREIRVVMITIIMQSILNYALHNKAYDLIYETAQAVFENWLGKVAEL